MGACRVFFFRQKTAYEVGLGIPAEPLFRSRLFYGSFLLPFKIISVTFRRVIRTNHKKASKIWRHERSEERRVGKECRSRWRRPQHKKKKERNGSPTRPETTTGCRPAAAFNR